MLGTRIAGTHHGIQAIGGRLNRALMACVALPDSQSAWDFLRTKQTPNSFPNLQSYQIGLEACAAAVDWEKSVELFKLITGVSIDRTAIGWDPLEKWR